MPKQKLKTVRRSVALPGDLIDDVLSVAPKELKGNLNRLVLVSLRDFVARRRAEVFAEAMAERPIKSPGWQRYQSTFRNVRLMRSVPVSGCCPSLRGATP